MSLIGLVPKKVAGDFRVKHHLSSPKEFSVNDFIDPKLCSVQYTSFNEAVKMIHDVGRNCKLFKMNLKNAFRNLPVKFSDVEFLSFNFWTIIVINVWDWSGCDSAMNCFVECLEWLSVALAEEKTEGPTEVLVFYFTNKLT